MSIKRRLGQIEAQLSALGTRCPDFSQMTDEELAAVIEEINQQVIQELGEVKGRAEIARIEGMSDAELDRRIRQ